MADISAKLVKELREKTGAGMMDCKRALVETDGNIEKAAENLRKKGLMDAAKKSSRTAADGLIAIATSSDNKSAAVVEINAETDFVARNEKFQDLVLTIANIALETSNTNEILEKKIPGSSSTVKEEIDSLISLIGENMTLRRSMLQEVKHGTVVSYVHNAVAPTMGKIGVLVALESETDKKEELMNFGKKIAMHIAAANPSYLCSDCVPQHLIDKEREIIIERAKGLGKPEPIAQKMADGRIASFFEEIVLLNQTFVIDNKTKISDLLVSFGKEIGSPVKITSYSKFILGEGIEKEETNFAEEVKSFTK